MEIIRDKKHFNNLKKEKVQYLLKLFSLLLFPDKIFLISIFDLLKYSLKMKIILIKSIE